MGRYEEGPLDNGVLDEKMEKLDVEKDANRTWTPVKSPSKWSIPFIEVPEFMRKLTGRVPPKRPTAWLDGLRGFAAFLVYWHHHHLWAHDSNKMTIYFENSFGFDGKYYFVALPFVRILFSGGHYAVTVFFVISGYVLSQKGLKLIQAGELTKLAEVCGSALFRRWFRLFLPVFGATIGYMLFCHIFGIWTQPGAWTGGLFFELWIWYCAMKNYSFVFDSSEDGKFPGNYNFHLWSIPVEYKGSVIVYTALLAFSRATQKARLWGWLALIFYFMYIVDGWYAALFVAGILIADLDLLAEQDKLPEFFKKFENFKEFIFFNMFLVSMYLGGVPSWCWDISCLTRNPGWANLAILKPQAVFDYKWFYLFWAATMLVVSVPRVPLLKHFFETRFCQYLGRISFALYLVHGPVLWTLGDRIYSAVGFPRPDHEKFIPAWKGALPLPTSGPLGFEPAFWIPHIILLPATLWVAELVTKFFDEPSVTFTAWLYKKILPEKGGVKP